MEDIQQRISSLFSETFHTPIESMEILPGAGSSRQYYRIASKMPTSILACYGSNTEENNTFIYFSSVLKQAKIHVPEIYAIDNSHEIYLISDLGYTDVLTAKQNMDENETKILYKHILHDLLRIQTEGGKLIDFTKCFVRPEFDKTAMRWDLYYFKYYYLKLCGIECNDQKLEVDFETLLNFLDTAERKYFMYRDFQARNIMLNNNTLGYIDYQGAMKGPLQYDVVSLLYQAKANLSPETRTELLMYYCKELHEIQQYDEQKFRELFQGFVFIRILQTLGAYGFRGYIQGKEHFIASIPQALANVKEHSKIIASLLHLPYLTSIIEQMDELKAK